MISIIIPYRNRKHHLRMFLSAIDRHLAKEKISAEILIVEQSGNALFNRGKLCNIGALQAKFNYYVFHDVDMIPGKPCSYEPLQGVTHLAGSASQFRHKMPYATYLGGVTMFDRESFNEVNGFSNKYEGWGAEDDDLYQRCVKAGLKILNKPYRFQSLPHSREKQLVNIQANRKLLSDGTDMLNDGLLQTDYKIISASGNLKPNFEVKHLIADINANIQRTGKSEN